MRQHLKGRLCFSHILPVLTPEVQHQRQLERVLVASIKPLIKYSGSGSEKCNKRRKESSTVKAYVHRNDLLDEFLPPCYKLL